MDVFSEIIILFLGALIVLYVYLRRNFNYWKERGIPYEKPIFLFGNFFDVFSGKKVLGELLSDIYL